MPERDDLQAPRSKILKTDVFGQTTLKGSGNDTVVCRDARQAAWWARPIARWLLAREARALAVLAGTPGIPELLRAEKGWLERRFVEGEPMQVGKPDDLDYFHRAARVLRSLHRQDVVHNDLAKEPNLLVAPDGPPVLIDFQLAWHAPRRGRLFRLLAYDDVRHLLKHKRTYCKGHLTARERAILDTPSLPARIWMKTVKPVYLFVTRRILRWRDREGAGDRF